MIRATLHFVHGETEDQIELEADSLDQLQKKARSEVEIRKPDDYWSSNVRIEPL